MTIPTVRVANPKTALGYMVINASDYRENVHGPLWHEQEPGFTGKMPPRAPVQPYSDEEHRKAAALMFDFIEAEREDKGLPTYASLTAHQRLVWLDKKRDEFTDALSRHMRRMPTPEVVVPDGVVPGETPGWPVDVVSGKPLWLPDHVRQQMVDRAREDAEHATRMDAERAALSRQEAPPGGEGGQTATSQPTPPPSAPEGGQQAPGSAETPPPAGDAPSWLRPATQQPTEAAKPPVAATPGPRSVEKGPGAKWYVMQGGKPASEGFKTKAEAEAEAMKQEEAAAAAARTE